MRVKLIMQNNFTTGFSQLGTLRELRERGTITAAAAALHLITAVLSALQAVAADLRAGLAGPSTR
jgi:hypothetical protein